MKKRSNKTVAYYFIFIWIVAAFLLESSDLWISINLYNPNSVWAKFLENFIHEAPVVYLIPGKPSFLPSSKDKNKNKNKKDQAHKNTKSSKESFPLPKHGPEQLASG